MRWQKHEQLAEQKSFETPPQATTTTFHKSSTFSFVTLPHSPIWWGWGWAERLGVGLRVAGSVAGSAPAGRWCTILTPVSRAICEGQKLELSRKYSKRVLAKLPGTAAVADSPHVRTALSLRGSPLLVCTALGLSANVAPLSRVGCALPKWSRSWRSRTW